MPLPGFNPNAERGVCARVVGIAALRRPRRRAQRQATETNQARRSVLFPFVPPSRAGASQRDAPTWFQPERRKRSLRQGGRDRRATASPSPSAASGDGKQSGEAGCLTPFVPPCRAEASQRDAPTWPLPALESGFRAGSRAGEPIPLIRCSTDSSNPSQSRNWIRFKSDQGLFHWCSSTIPKRAAIFCD